MGYAFRLLCVCLTSFFFVHCLSGFIVIGLTPWAIRISARMPSEIAARFLFAMRLSPPLLASVIVAVLCIPSFVSFEPRGILEPVGPPCLFATFLALVIWATTLLRATRALLVAHRFQRSLRYRWFNTAEQTSVLITEGDSPALALTGLFRSKLIVSRRALAALSSEELHSAILHEQAHQSSRDNLKRLILLLAPGLLPFWNSFSALEQAWNRFAEWAADDRASGQSAERSLSLAAALVRVARLNQIAQPVPLVTSFFVQASDLSERVERLLNTKQRLARRPAISTPIAGAGLILLLVTFALQSATLASVHRLLELLIQ